MSYLDKAIQLAATKLEDKTDKANKPLILHALSVMFQLETEEEMMAGVLHDVEEESGMPLNLILGWIYGDFWYNSTQAKRIEDALKRLNHKKGITYADYIYTISGNPLATKVKIADLKDNLREDRLNLLLDPDLREFLKKRYTKSLDTLMKTQKGIVYE